jgi:uncharacterized tellurite resistance protein B-like protein
MLEQSAEHKLILKILIGSAWVDRHLDAHEVTYLHALLTRYHLEGDRELRDCLARPMLIDQTESLVVGYLKEANDEQRLALLAKIGKVLIADDQVSEQEHDLLDDYHELMGRIPAPADPSEPSLELVPQLVKMVGQFARKVMQAASKLP